MKLKDIRIGKRIFTLMEDGVKIIDILNVTKYDYYLVIEYIDLVNDNIKCLSLSISEHEKDDYWFTARAMKNKG